MKYIKVKDTSGFKLYMISWSHDLSHHLPSHYLPSLSPSTISLGTISFWSPSIVSSLPYNPFKLRWEMRWNIIISLTYHLKLTISQSTISFHDLPFHLTYHLSHLPSHVTELMFGLVSSLFTSSYMAGETDNEMVDEMRWDVDHQYLSLTTYHLMIYHLPSHDLPSHLGFHLSHLQYQPSWRMSVRW